MTKRPAIDSEARIDKAHARRMFMAAASTDKTAYPPLEVLANGDNDLSRRPMTFAKGLVHDETGMVASADIDALRAALCGQTGTAETDPAFDVPRATEMSYTPGFRPKGSTSAKFRKYESPLTGLYYENQGLDPASVAMHAAPALGTSELVAEMAEVYAMAVVRDMSFAELSDPASPLYRIDPTKGESDPHRKVAFKRSEGDEQDATVGDLVAALAGLSWFGTGAPTEPPAPVDAPYSGRRREGRAGLELAGLFRGSTSGAKEEPYLSQFMLLGTKRRDGSGSPKDGIVSFGTNRINQRVDAHRKGLDYMTSFAEWLDVQNGVDLRGTDEFEKAPRFLQTPRDLASYVHFDQLYQAYFNACLIMLENGVPFDPGFPEASEHRPEPKNREGFASFGGPQILSMLTEVATRGLRAVRRQKFQIHLRARPERLAALIALYANGHTEAIGFDAVDEIARMAKALGVRVAGKPGMTESPLMYWVRSLNAAQNLPDVMALRGYEATGKDTSGYAQLADNYLLPMAFPEGSPMHASYGAGHATVAGACVTVLKAFFDTEGRSIDAITGLEDGKGYQAIGDADQELEPVPASKGLTVEGELNKLAANISIGRNMAGVHFYSDYFDSLRMGERVAIGVLKEQMNAYAEPVSMSLRSFDGDRLTLSTTGGGDSTLRVRDAGGAPVAEQDWWLRHVHNTYAGSAPATDLLAADWSGMKAG